MAPSKQKGRLTEALILEVQAHPSIWNKTIKEYKDVGIKSNAWQNILANMRSSFTSDELVASNLYSIEGVKSHWKNLRDTYTRKKKESEGKSGAGLDLVLSKKEWPFLEMLRFLDQSDLYSDEVQPTSSHVSFLDNSDSMSEDGENVAPLDQDSISFSDVDDSEHLMNPNNGTFKTKNFRGQSI